MPAPDLPPLVTVCTQLTIDRFYRFDALARQYQGPISVVMYVSYRTNQDLLSQQLCCAVFFVQHGLITVRRTRPECKPPSFPSIETYSVFIERRRLHPGAIDFLSIFKEKLQKDPHPSFFKIDLGRNYS